jgi:hypothetical protein
MNETGTIVAVEPDDERREGLETTIRQNRLDDIVEIRKQIVGDNEAQAYLEAAASFRPRDILTVDSFDHAFDLVKIDVDGGEVDVLAGMSETLERGCEVICEIHPDAIADYGDSLDDIQSILYEFGYCSFRIADDGLYEESPTDATGVTRYLFTRRELVED